MDKKRIEAAVREILFAIGEDPDRPGLVGTPDRIARMYEEIYRRVAIMREKHPDKTTSELCAMVVIQPAPKFYLTPGSAKIMVCKARKEWIRRKQLRLCRY